MLVAVACKSAYGEGMKTIGDLIEHNARYFGSREAFL